MISFVLALIFSIVWVYIIPEKYHQQPPTRSNDDEEDQANFTIEAVRNRRQAQERLFAQLEQSKHLRIQRQEMNAKPYHAHLLPVDVQAITLLALFDCEIDAYRALVYVQAGDHATFNPDQFNAYWQKPLSMLWAWQGDNIIEDYGENELKQRMRERYTEIKTSLLETGWILQGEIREDYNLISCYRRER